MTILQIFNKYQYAGGEEASVLRVADTLGRSHKVIRCYFDSKEWAEKENIFDYPRQAALMIYNPAAIRRVNAEIKAHQPDIVLLHNTFPICSAALIHQLVRGEIPVVQYIHNFRPFSVGGYCWGKTSLLDDGLRKNFIPEIIDASWQDSRIRTAWYAMILWFLHFNGTYQRIDKWLAISDFMRGKFIEAGIQPYKIETLRHSWNIINESSEPAAPPEPDHNPFLLFIGRLTTAKGIEVMLDAWKEVRRKLDNVSLVIAGEGPLEELVKSAADRDPSIEFRGHVSGRDKSDLLSSARAVIIPSIWWEPLGIVVYEAYDYGKPALAAASGGLTETVLHEKTGLLHQPGNSEQLASQMQSVLADPAYAETLGLEGRNFLLQNTKPENWAESIEKTLKSIVSPPTISDASHPPCPQSPPLAIAAYLADQNPGHDRSLGISRMSKVILEEMCQHDDVELQVVSSMSSQQGPSDGAKLTILPWGTRSKLMRVVTDHLHPVLSWASKPPDAWYFPKGFLPRFRILNAPSIVTIHDTIIQHYWENYPDWRKSSDYAYWAQMLKSTIINADGIFTVSQTAKVQILDFMKLHNSPEKEIIVTYEPCFYEEIEQPIAPVKGNSVVHLASREPHKRTCDLIQWWAGRSKHDKNLPILELVGRVPSESTSIVSDCPCFRRHPFLSDDKLKDILSRARALILPSEIEGFGLPALEAYYLGTPVCYASGTSIGEILEESTALGAFQLDSPETLWPALDQVLSMPQEEVRRIGLELRERFAAKKVVEIMLQGFRQVIGRS